MASLFDPTNSLALTSVFSVNGESLVTITTLLAESLPNQEQADLMAHILNHPPLDADKFPVLSQATSAYQFAIKDASGVTLEEVHIDIAATTPQTERVELLSAIGNMIANFAGQANPPAEQPAA